MSCLFFTLGLGWMHEHSRHHWGGACEIPWAHETLCSSQDQWAKRDTGEAEHACSQMKTLDICRNKFWFWECQSCPEWWYPRGDQGCNMASVDGHGRAACCDLSHTESSCARTCLCIPARIVCQTENCSLERRYKCTWITWSSKCSWTHRQHEPHKIGLWKQSWHHITLWDGNQSVISSPLSNENSMPHSMQWGLRQLQLVHMPSWQIISLRNSCAWSCHSCIGWSYSTRLIRKNSHTLNKAIDSPSYHSVYAFLQLLDHSLLEGLHHPQQPLAEVLQWESSGHKYHQCCYTLTKSLGVRPCE